jgi:hypothetical protein
MRLFNSFIFACLAIISLTCAMNLQNFPVSASATATPIEGTTIDSTKCRELGFANPHTSSPPVCGTCDVLADLLKASSEEKLLSDDARKANKNLKKQFMSECRSCCVPGTFEEDADAVLRNQNNLVASAASASSLAGINQQAAAGGFVSVEIEVDRSLTENSATPISKLMRLHSSTWNAEKISFRFTENMAPRLHLKRPNGKVDIVNVGSWEAELIWEYLRKGLIS